MTSLRRTRLLLLAAVTVAAAAVWGVSKIEREAITHSSDELAATQQLLGSMLDQETGLRGFLLTRDRVFLEPYERGRDEFRAALARTRALVGGPDTEKGRELAAAVAVARDWQREASSAVADVTAGGSDALSTEALLHRKSIMDRFRTAQGRLARTLTAERNHALSLAEWIPVGLMFGLAALIGIPGYLLISLEAKRERRRAVADRRFDAEQREFSVAMQTTRNEDEANALLKRHLERTIDGSAIVLNRSNSDDRLYAATDVPTGELAVRLADAKPDSCLAVRMGRTNERAETDREPLISCELCQGLGDRSLCKPSLVGGEVIGSVLVTYDHELTRSDRRRIDESAGQAAPVLANLRNLAIAETRAATDALTGLPNSRSVQETLKRLVAQTHRMRSSMGVILLDLDHFKRINDTYGHDRGDDALGAVGDAIQASLRESDFAGRYGGEEFVILLPDTEREGAELVAEKVRRNVEKIDVPGLDRVTASIGLALLPVHGVDGDAILRAADRALYRAKGAGRNRVEVAEDADEMLLRDDDE